MTEEIQMANLGKVDHIVVLNLENRSFDHMLGYLSLEGGRGDIDGLRAEFANEHGGRRYPVRHLDTTAISDDPDNSASAIDRQIGGGKMNGFVASYALTLARCGVQDADAGRVMGYYNGADVPVHDHLASEFAICDRWFSSVPGSTWPNRLYSICGRADGSRDGRRLTCRRCMTSRRSSGTWTPTASPGAGTPSKWAPCAWPMAATASATTTGSRSSATPT